MTVAFSSYLERLFEVRRLYVVKVIQNNKKYNRQSTFRIIKFYYNLHVHEILFISGTWPTFSPNLSEEQAEQIIVLAVESGINVFDLSEAHSGMYSKYILSITFLFFVFE